MEGLILTVEDLKEQLEYFLKQDAFVFDIESMDGIIPETRGIPAYNRVVWLSMATYGRAIVIPMGHPNGDVLLRKAYRKKNKETGKMDSFPPVYDAPPEQLKPSVVFSILRPLFFSKTIRKIAHSAIMDFVSVAKYYDGEIPCGPVEDTMTTVWMTNENIGQREGGGPRRPIDKGLKTLTKFNWGVDYDHEGVGKKIELHPFSKVAMYALQDAIRTWLVKGEYRRKCEEEGVMAHLALEEQVTEVLLRMNQVGAPMDVQALEALRDDLTAELVKLEANIYKAAKRVFNVNSTPQKQQILYGLKKDGNQGLKPTKLTKGGIAKKKNGEPLDKILDWSTDKEALEEHANNPVVRALLEYQEVNKLLGTYVIGYLGVEGDPDKPRRVFNGRIHAALVQNGTVSSRFSCRDPNLQNIPRPDKPLGKRVRGLFKAPEGYKLVVADYAQIEYRVLAHFIGRGVLFDGFWAGIDAHKATAMAMYGCTLEEVTKEMRQHSKALGFGVLFGSGPAKLAAMLDCSLDRANELLEEYARNQPEVIRFKKHVVNEARKREVPHIITLTGFKRRTWDLNHEWFGPRGRAERQIFNSLIQGSAAGIIKTAMVRVHEALKADFAAHDHNPADRIDLVLSVHDELVLLAPDHRAQDAKLILEEAMAGEEMQKMLKVPLEADAMIVERWSEAKD